MLQLVVLTNYLTQDQIRPHRQYAMLGNSLVCSLLPPSSNSALLALQVNQPWITHFKGKLWVSFLGAQKGKILRQFSPYHLRLTASVVLIILNCHCTKNFMLQK